jgi:protein-S-isoprenylcysteine O-methyltransferase Ste14
MSLLDRTTLGMVILGLLGLLVAVKHFATGSILDKPKGNLMVQLVNIFNLFFLLVVNPLSAVLLLTGQLVLFDSTRLLLNAPWNIIAEIIGLALYIAGFLLMAWALITLGRHYQLGGSAPRSDDELIVAGPYRLIRHPMYAAALSITLGLVGLLQSWIFVGVLGIYLVLIIPLITMEEAGLRKAYGAPYSTYQQKTRKLIPFVY